MLLDLPPELVQLILLNSTTPAFLQAAFACRALYEIATNCREVLVHHLEQTPGFNLEISSLDTSLLFQLVKKYAYQQLYGAQFHADCVVVNSTEQILDVRASSLASLDDQVLAIIAYRDRGTVDVFHIENEQVSRRIQLNIAWSEPGVVEILKTAFDGDDDIYVLQRFTPSRDEYTPDSEHPFIKQAMQTRSRGRIYLARHSLGAISEPAELCAFPDHDDWEPSGLAVADEETFAIAWRHSYYSDYEVVLYTNVINSGYDSTSNVDALSYTPHLYVNQSTDNQSTAGRIGFRGPIVDLAFNDRSTQLLYYYQAQCLYGSFQSINPETPPESVRLYNNISPVQFSDSLNLLFSIGVPFFGTHETLNNNGLETCRWKYLALGIATHREEKWTVACLLKSEAICRATNCGHVLHLERGRRLQDWVVMARLWGFQDSKNSAGCRAATSKCGTRIAIANWKAVYIWALEPGALIEGNANGYYPASFTSASTGLIELQPIVLPLDAVCFHLHFTDQANELVAFTDRGLMLWDLSPTGQSRRTFQELAV